jgi:type VI secretion system protein ImpF
MEPRVSRPPSGARASLLDRLTGSDEAHTRARDPILRDLGWLLNSIPLEVSCGLEAYPHVRRSVLNFGTTALGAAAGASTIESAVREALVRFEPRIEADSIDVRYIARAEDAQHPSLSLAIEGTWRTPDGEEHIRVVPRIDADSGHATLAGPGAD